MKLNKRVPDKEDNTYTLTALTIQMSSQQVVKYKFEVTQLKLSNIKDCVQQSF